MLVKRENSMQDEPVAHIFLHDNIQYVFSEYDIIFTFDILTEFSNHFLGDLCSLFQG